MLTGKCRLASGASSVTVDDLKQAIAYAERAHAETAELFSEAIYLLIINARAPGCDKIAAAGAIPVIVQLLARFPVNVQVVERVCGAIYILAHIGSAAVKAETRGQADVITLLEAASARLQSWGKKHSNGSNNAAEALKLLRK